jgi:hypothetical protein
MRKYAETSSAVQNSFVSAIAHLANKIEIITVAPMIIASGKEKQNQIEGQFPLLSIYGK